MSTNQLISVGEVIAQVRIGLDRQIYLYVITVVAGLLGRG
jgi:hypothetical protein